MQPFTNVNGYAELLHITPKYFSSICKKLSGKTANEIIKEETIKQAKILLHDNSLSIKQVADQLSFTNQSHFGTYFHRYTGMSPQQFRQAGVI
jgi:AraC-like DNA-binding protein